MNLNFCVIDSLEGASPLLTINNLRLKIIISVILDTMGNTDKLLIFINSVIENKNEKEEYWTNGYTAQVVKKDGKKMIKIFFRLADDYEPSYIEPEEFKKILEIYIQEKQKFDKDPEQYKIGMIKKGAKVINVEDYKDKAEEYKKVVAESEKGIIIVNNKEEKDKLEGN